MTEHRGCEDSECNDCLLFKIQLVRADGMCHCFEHDFPHLHGLPTITVAQR